MHDLIEHLMELTTSPHWGGVLPYLIEGIQITLYITFIGVFFGLILGIVTGLARLSKSKIIYGLATCYIEVIRGTPILVQVLFIYFALADFFGITFDHLTAGIIAIAINAGAYVAEIVRGGVASIDKGQMEAGRSIGLSSFQTMRYIIWPQALKRMIPPLGNQFIISLKDTSLFAVISTGEAVFMGRQYVATTGVYFEPYFMMGLVYLSITIPCMIILRAYERKLDV
ncbi:amino acid ABC transporter permease [Texcoconibacillus texcoconensis]|uniref:Glutamine transport system permease protein n=1 Tax=Texcoconibacillus texcoconensis TaxID=1095777 RepID=A0A840QM82_9BACI|nr:amino acid ABC transporter permease [Texcoconibacillus texcoconensis]MBB5172477.1 glutamine transport system permease protein [Texcoconibacillus texcoconensis]